MRCVALLDRQRDRVCLQGYGEKPVGEGSLKRAVRSDFLCFWVPEDRGGVQVRRGEEG